MKRNQRPNGIGATRWRRLFWAVVDADTNGDLTGTADLLRPLTEFQRGWILDYLGPESTARLLPLLPPTSCTGIYRKPPKRIRAKRPNHYWLKSQGILP